MLRGTVLCPGCGLPTNEPGVYCGTCQDAMSAGEDVPNERLRAVERIRKLAEKNPSDRERVIQ